MNWITWILLILVVIAAIYIALLYVSKKAEKRGEEPKGGKMPYELVPCLLTNKELLFYKDLKPIANELNLVICPKVRLADIVVIPNGTAKYTTWLNYIKAKHVDFVLCNKDMQIKLVIEIDDKSHLKEDRKERDCFVDRVFEQANLKIIHIWKWDSSLNVIVSSALGLTDTP